ncbi:GTP binding protein [Lobosporangium transversale]|nr:GTP binding protein [Lobosporangium transversale]
MATFPVPSAAIELSPWENHQGSLPPEIDIEGNIEYKLKLIATAPDRFEHLVTQLKWRLAEGNGSAIYEIGVADDGSFVGLSPQDMEVSLQTLHRMADFLKADVTVLRKVSVESTQQNEAIQDGSSSSSAIARKQLSANSGSPKTKPEYLVVEAKVTSRLVEEHQFLEIRVALVGGPDAGKSTLLGRLAHGIADNGRGKARLNLLRHRHEISTGRTSSISHEIIGFTAKGATVNYSTTNISSWQEICESSAKVVTLLDTCGHPRFLKTTISGLTGHAPDYACLVVDSRIGGVNEMTKEHLALAVTLGLPTFVVVTKMDVATRDQLRATVTALMTLIRHSSPSCIPSINAVNIDTGISAQSHRFEQSTTSTSSTAGNNAGHSLQTFAPVIVHNERDLETTVKRFSDESTIQETNSVAIPILLLSSVTGENVNLLEKFLFLLPKPGLNIHGGSYLQEPACYQIEEIYNIPGTVVGGFLHAGKIEVHDHSKASQGAQNMRLYLGPVDRDGSFIPVVVKSIHRQRMSMRSIDSGHTATLAIDGPGLTRVKVRRGMVVLESDTDPRGTCCQKFEAVIEVLAHEGIFGVGYQGMIHCGSVHQNARVVKIELLPGSTQESVENLSTPTLLDSTDDLGRSPIAEALPSGVLNRNNQKDYLQSTRSRSPSSDYESGTGSSIPESIIISRSNSLHEENMSDDLDNRPRYRPRTRRHHLEADEGGTDGMIPISTMRSFRRLSVRQDNHTPSLITPQSTEIKDSIAVDQSDTGCEPVNVLTGQTECDQVDEDPVELRTGSRARVVFQFCHDVQFMREGTTVLFRHGGTKCVGKVLRML